MRRQSKIILFSVILLIAFINKQCNNENENHRTQNNNTTTKTNITSTKTNQRNDTENVNNDFAVTARPSSGFSPYNNYYGKGIYHNYTDNTIKVTAPVQKDIVFFLKNVYTDRMTRNEYIRAGSVFRLTGIPYGKYKFYYLYGEDWSTYASFKGLKNMGNFLKNKGVGKTDDIIDCEFDEGYYGTYELTLQLRSNGNLSTVEGTENDL